MGVTVGVSTAARGVSVASAGRSWRPRGRDELLLTTTDGRRKGRGDHNDEDWNQSFHDRISQGSFF